MTSYDSATIDPAALGETATLCHSPSYEHNVESVRIEQNAMGAQDNSSGSELCITSASDRAYGTEKSKRKSRPCKGKRLRYRKFMERLRDDVMAFPHLMDVQSVAWPPSLQNDFQKQQKLMMQLTESKLQQLKMQGEPCTVNLAHNCVPIFRMSL